MFVQNYLNALFFGNFYNCSIVVWFYFIYLEYFFHRVLVRFGASRNLTDIHLPWGPFFSIMTKHEALHEIFSQHKFYVGYCSQAYGSQLKIQFETGRITKKATDKILKHFGYKLKNPEIWEKTK